jgi:hypothetical protein
VYVDASDPSMPLVIDPRFAATASVAWSPSGSTLARVLTNGTVRVDYAWSESDFCEYVLTVRSVGDLDEAVGLGDGGSRCGAGADLSGLAALPSAQRSSPSGKTATSVPVTTVTSTTTVSTTTTTLDPEAEKAAAQRALDQMAADLEAIDYSRLSIGECGIFAMTVHSYGLRFFEWTSGEWSEQTEQLDVPFDVPPLLVTTNDYTDDGARDFLVTFDGAAVGGREFGAILSYWECNWWWVDMYSLAGDIVKALDGLRYEDGVLLATDYLPEGGRGEVYLWYSRENSIFMAERL